MIYTEKFKIPLKDIGKDNKIKNRAVLEILENIACYHSDLVGYGVNNIKETKEIGTLTKKELEMMTVLWGSDTALTASEILKASTDKTWKDKALHILINSLLKKNLIVVDGFKKMEKVYARSFKPAISQTDYIWTHLTSGLDKKKRRNLIEEIIKNFDQEELLIAKQIIECIIQ